MRSITGFGRGSVSGHGYSISIDLKTVNNRFLDVNLRLGSETQAFESIIKQTISKRLSRGRVDVNLQYDRTENSEFELNLPMITGYLSAMKQLKDKFSISGEPDLNVIARLPNALIPKKEDLDEEFAALLNEALELALNDLEKMRTNEGSLLRNELDSRLKDIAARIPLIEDEASGVVEEYSLRLTKRINDMLAKSDSQIEIDQGRLAQEIAYLSDRADISEEIIRLKAHIEHFRSIFDDDAEIGKRLDFLTQELNREANTISSKTGNLTIKENALAIKSDIEKIREQVQNIE